MRCCLVREGILIKLFLQLTAKKQNFKYGVIHLVILFQDMTVLLVWLIFLMLVARQLFAKKVYS